MIIIISPLQYLLCNHNNKSNEFNGVKGNYFNTQQLVDV